MHGCLPGTADLGSTQTISSSRLRSPAPHTTRFKARHVVTCEVQTPSKSKGVVMRELPLSGSEATQSTKGSKQTYVSKPTNQQASSSQAYRTTRTTQQDISRRNSSQQASTSSSSSSVSFPPRQNLGIVETKRNGSTRNSKQRLDANIYDVTTSVNQAAPGFTAASRSASDAAALRAASFIDAGQSE